MAEVVAGLGKYSQQIRWHSSLSLFQKRFFASSETGGSLWKPWCNVVGTLEVQAVADSQAKVLTFGVRDCSVQRNNQKIIEETPPAGLDEQEMLAIEACSARLLEVARYQGAGTVEYLYDIDRKQAYFMEVNTPSSRAPHYRRTLSSRSRAFTD